jgi:hypothetical protein
MCTNGGCRRVPSVMVRVGFRSTDEKAVCSACADALRPLYPTQRDIEGVPQWLRRQDRNARAWERAA